MFNFIEQANVVDDAAYSAVDELFILAMIISMYGLFLMQVSWLFHLVSAGSCDFTESGVSDNRAPGICWFLKYLFISTT